MGVKVSKVKLLKAHELDEYAKITTFSNEQINHLYIHFKKISKLEKDDGVIDLDEFCMALKLQKSLLSERIFNYFDINHDSVINFNEFITGISILVQDNIESQIKLTFNIFDFEHTGKIYSNDMAKLIKSGIELHENNIKLDEDIIKNNVDMTFTLLNQNQKRDDLNYIDFNQYRNMIRENPIILKWLFIDLEKIRITAQEIMKNKVIIK